MEAGKRMKLGGMCVAICLLLTPIPAMAQLAGSGPAWQVEGSVSALSDYVWRGVSQTRGKPALQLEVAANHTSGFHIGAAASNVDFTAVDDEDDGIRYELAPYIAWSREFGGAGNSLDVSLGRVMYPGYRDGFKVDYSELEATFNYAEYYHVGIAYSPNIFNLGGRGIHYSAGFEAPAGESGWNVKGQIGHYDLDKAAGDSYNDFLMGVNRGLGPVRIELAWSTTSSYGDALSENLDEASQARSRWILGLSWAF